MSRMLSSTDLSITTILKFEPVLITLLCWLVFIIDSFLPLDLRHFGVIPRDIGALPHILSWWLIHANFAHLLSNTIPLLILGALLRFHGVAIFWWVTIGSAILTGVLVWLFSSAVVVGISGVVYAYWAYLVVIAFKKPSIRSIATVVVVAILYGGMIFGVLDLRAHISWVAHTGGLFSGAVLALFLYRFKPS